jgi:hypothetical protein
MLAEVCTGLAGVGATLLLLAFAERRSVDEKKKHLPGPSFLFPFIGDLFRMIFNPFPFYLELAKYGPASWTKIANK